MTPEELSEVKSAIEGLRNEIADGLRAAYKTGRNDLVDSLLNGYDLVAKNDHPTFIKTEKLPRLRKTDVARLYAAISKECSVNMSAFAQAFGTEANHGFRVAVAAAKDDGIGDKSHLERYNRIISLLFDLLPKNRQDEIIKELTSNKK
jgi:hypothetical protein